MWKDGLWTNISVQGLKWNKMRMPQTPQWYSRLRRCSVKSNRLRRPSIQSLMQLCSVRGVLRYHAICSVQGTSLGSAMYLRIYLKVKNYNYFRGATKTDPVHLDPGQWRSLSISLISIFKNLNRIGVTQCRSDKLPQRGHISHCLVIYVGWMDQVHSSV